MEIIQEPKTIQRKLMNLKRTGKTIGFVPTMGNLHEGHLSLVELAKERCDVTVASIFVNPMQFGPNEDFNNYPRTLTADTEKLETIGIDYLFVPTSADIFPMGKDTHTSVEVNRLTEKLCGASRPGHFSGVTLIVNILFNIIQPDVAVFGKKDYQQYQIIRAMVKDLMIPVTIVGAEVRREESGLAMSSRNSYLSSREVILAGQLRKILLNAARQIEQYLPLQQISSEAVQSLSDKGFKIDYFAIIRREDLEPAKEEDKSLLIAAAAWLGKPRLLDNIEVDRT